jgi:hypothetical protein
MDESHNGIDLDLPEVKFELQFAYNGCAPDAENMFGATVLELP